MYDVFTYIWLLSMVNVGKYTIHWVSGYPNRILHIDLDLILQKRNIDAGFLNPESAPTIFCFCGKFSWILAILLQFPNLNLAVYNWSSQNSIRQKLEARKSSVVKIGCLGAPLIFFSGSSYFKFLFCSFFAVWIPRSMPFFATQVYLLNLSSWWLSQPIWNNMLVKLDYLPRDRGEHNKYLKPPTSYGAVFFFSSFFANCLLLGNQKSLGWVTRWSLSKRTGNEWPQMIPNDSAHSTTSKGTRIRFLKQKNNN